MALFSRYLSSFLIACALLILAPSARTNPAQVNLQAAGKQRQADLVALFDVTNVFGSARTSVNGVVERLGAAYPSIPAEVWSNFVDRVTDRDVLIALYVPIYRKHLSQNDVHAVLAFYRSPLGMHLLEQGPAIQAESRTLIQTWVFNLITTVLEQSNGVPVNPAPNQSSSAPSATDALSSQQLDAIHELLRVSGTLREARQTVLNALTNMEHDAQSEPAETLPASFWQLARMHFANDDELLPLWTPAYAHAFSASEIQGLIDFYRSPLGIRFIRAMSLIHAECVAAATTLANDAARSAVREVLGPLPQWRMTHPSPSPPAAAHAGVE